MATATETPLAGASWSTNLRSVAAWRRAIPVPVGVAVLLFVLAGVVGPLIAPHDPNAVDLANARIGPSGEHWLGTDRLGRDVFSRLLAGAQTSLLAIVLVLTGAIAIGSVIGVIAGVVGGLVDVPVIAVPTSVGYGASFGGIAALLGMLNSCANGVAVVNIDNGFGAGCLASMINHL